MMREDVAHIAEWAQNLVNAHARRNPDETYATLSERDAIDQLYRLINQHARGIINRRVA